METIRITLFIAVALLGHGLAFPQNSKVGSAQQDPISFLKLTTQAFSVSLRNFNIQLQNELKTEKNPTKLKSFTEMQKTVALVESRARTLPDLITNTYANQNTEITKGERNIKGQWDKWGEAELNRLTAAKKYDQLATAKNILDGYIDGYKTKLAECTKNAEEEISQFESNVDSTVDRYQAVLKTLIEQNQACKTNTDTAKDENLCLTAPKTSLAQLQRAQNAINTLNSKGLLLQRTIYQNRPCVYDVTSQFELGKDDVEGKIDQVIAGTYTESTPSNNNNDSKANNDATGKTG